MIFMMLAGSIQASVGYDSYYEKAQNRTAQKIGAAAIGAGIGYGIKVATGVTAVGAMGGGAGFGAAAGPVGAAAGAVIGLAIYGIFHQIKKEQHKILKEEENGNSRADKNIDRNSKKSKKWKIEKFVMKGGEDNESISIDKNSNSGSNNNKEHQKIRA